MILVFLHLSEQLNIILTNGEKILQEIIKNCSIFDTLPHEIQLKGVLACLKKDEQFSVLLAL